MKIHEYETDFAKVVYETIQTIEKNTRFSSIDGRVIRTYMDKCLAFDSYFLKNLDGVYELARVNLPKDEVADFCVALSFRKMVSNAGRNFSDIIRTSAEAVSGFVTRRKDLVAEIEKEKAKLDNDKTLKLRGKATSLHIQEMIEQVTEEKEERINSLYSKLSDENEHMTTVLFGTRDISEEQQKTMESFIKSQHLSFVKFQGQ